MSGKKLVLNADGFGLSKPINKAVLHGYLEGFLSSASLCANGSEFNPAVNEIIPECPNLGIGVHLNITKGYSLTKADLLTDKRGIFNKNFSYFLFNKNQKLFKQIEFEFRTQIETVMNYTSVDHIDSVNNIHACPEIFKLILKLANEYNIPFVRTHFEELYFVNSLFKHLNIYYPINLANLIVLNYLTSENKKNVKKFNLKTNDYISGILYKNLMDSNVVAESLKIIDNENCIIEVVINPCFYNGIRHDKFYDEFMITKDKDLKDKIQRLGFEITNYKKESYA